MPTATADLEVLAPPSGRATANLTVLSLPPGSRATADLVVQQPVAGKATADLAVNPATLQLHKRVAGQLVEHGLFKRVGGQLVRQGIYKRVNGQLTPAPGTAGPTLPAPVVTATVGNGSVTVAWQAVTGATGYRITRTGQTPIDVSAATFSRTITGLTNGATYTFTVQALPGGQPGTVTATPVGTTGLVKPVMGITGGSESTFNQINAQVGPVLSRRTYDGALPSSFAASAAASDVAAGRHSYWSWKPVITGTTNFRNSTSQQAAFSAFLDSIPANHRVSIHAIHEPENDIIKSSGTPTFTMAQWTELQNICGAIVRSKNRPNLRFGPGLMGPWTFDTRSPYYTGLDWSGLDQSLMDFVGIDPYRTSAGSEMSLQTMLTVNNSGSGTGGSAKSMLGRIAEWGPKPIAITEWGAYNASEASVAKFITDAYAWMKVWNAANPQQLITDAIWFNYTLIGSDNPLTGVEVTAYRNAVADSKIP